MNDQQQSRADALTYQEVEALATKHQFDMSTFDYTDSNSLVDLVNDAIRAVHRNSQPAAAPIVSAPADERAAFDLTDMEWLNVFERVSATVPNVFGSYMKVRAAFAREAIRMAEGAKRGTLKQIQAERKLTCEAIDGAMAFGYQNTNPPPSADHWLAPFWKIGRKQYAAEFALRYLDDQLTEYLEGMPADETSRNLRDIARNALVDIEAAPRSPAMAAAAPADERATDFGIDA
ncbi:hypothetical protein QZM82_13265 [Burkholderia cepacia]|uniref:hypothetical protein n=1 Tax=Burkholderia cepacia TaxID=292 RepID=UPI0026502ABB|nr:hypothetical protein [Burkholderia cepacia]MDN7897160.1 hypothetical protein [Burkholderia cepacia]